MQIIKVKFLKGDAPAGKAYTYYSLVAVAVGDKVQINASAVGVVVAVDVPEAEVAPYRNRLKAIIGPLNTPPETYDALEATVAQSKYCLEHGVPHAAPKSGWCLRCNQNIYLPGKKACLISDYKVERSVLDSTGISVERAGQEYITKCPHCGWNFWE